MELLYTSEEALSYLENARSGKVKEASRFGHPELDDFLRFKQGNFIVVTGHANVGKTHVIMYSCLLHTMRNGTRWLIFSSENEVGSLQRKLIEFYTFLPIRNISDQKFYDAHAFVLGHFRFVRTDKMYNVFDLLQDAQNVYDEQPFDGFLIDPYNSLAVDRKALGNVSEHQYHYEATTALRVFCKQNNTIVIVNTHPTSEALRRTHPKGHEYEGHPTPPMAADVEGGGKFVNRADEFFVIHRYTQHETDWIYTDIHVRKVKDIETGGRPTPLNSPIRIRSITNNVGFSIGYKNLMHSTTNDPEPF